MSLLPRQLALRVALILLLVLAAGSAAFIVALRARLQEVTAPQMARDLAASIAGIRAVLATLSAGQQTLWMSQFNAGGEVALEPLPEPPLTAEPVRPMFRRMDLELRRLTGDDTRMRVEHRPRPQIVVDFRAGTRFYELSLPVGSLSWSSLLPLLWLFMAMGAAVWAAVLFVLWQVNRPLQRSAESLARSVNQLAEIDMPGSAPMEFRIFAERFNTLARRLKAQERERELILAGVSHDLRAPLTRIRMRAELIDDRSASEFLVRDVESMRHIIDQFLDYQRGGAIKNAGPVDLGTAARGVAARYRQLGKDVVLSERGQVTVRATTAVMERILNNLIDNALAYGAPPVELRIGRSEAGGVLEVRDHGPGVAASELVRLLQPFERLDEARGAQGHCGLGLTIVDRLVRQIGGELSLANHPEGGLVVRMGFARS